MKAIYKVFSIIAMLAGRSVATKIFRRLWRLAARQEEAPEVLDARRTWAEILAAAALQAMIAALIRAAADRVLAKVTHQLTGIEDTEGEDARTAGVQREGASAGALTGRGG